MLDILADTRVVAANETREQAKMRLLARCVVDEVYLSALDKVAILAAAKEYHRAMHDYNRLVAGIIDKQVAQSRR